MDFENKVVVVTGGASGIGKAICLAFLKANAKVICIDTDVSAGDLLVSEVNAHGHRDIEFLRMDVAHVEELALFIS
ncbi:MAG: SDR family NAD(P)-dependent oxidoreductase [Patescibacteria group bacterium]